MDFIGAFEELSRLSCNKELFEKYNLTEDEFGSAEEICDFLYYLEHEDSCLFEMANLRGNDVKVIERLPFSLFLSNKNQVHNRHAIRVKVLWNPSKMTSTPDGQMYLHGDYPYEVFSHKYKPTEKEISILRNFCKKYKVLFAAVWEGALDAEDFINFLAGLISFKQLLSKFIINDDDPEDLDYYKVNHCKSFEELEHLVLENKIFNMND